jgi:hypothetical protein
MFQFLLDHLIGILRPIGPHHWALAVRRLRRADGWLPPMLLIAAMATLFFLGQGFGPLGNVLAVRVFNYAAMATWLIVGSVASAAVTIDGLRNLRHLTPGGMLRPRWWFELSRLAWMILLLAALSLPLFHFSGIPRLRAAGDSLFRILPTMYVAFMLFGTAGYLVSLLARRRPRGRAFECVEYFYWLFGVVAAVTMFVVRIPPQVGWAQPATIVACAVAAAVIGAFILKVAYRWDATMVRKRTFERERQ